MIDWHLRLVFLVFPQSNTATDRAIRFRVCQFVARLLQNLGEGALIDDSLYDEIYKCMLERLKDKCATVRFHAILALARLQDPTDENCPITKGTLKAFSIKLFFFIYHIRVFISFFLF